MASFSPAAAAAFLTVLCAYILRVTAGFGVTWALTRASRSASVRFALWLVFLVGSTAYWLVSLATLVPPQHLAELEPNLAHAVVSSPVLLSPGLIQLIVDSLRVTLALYLLLLVCAGALGLWRRIGLVHALRQRSTPPAAVTDVFDAIACELGTPDCRLFLLEGLPSPASVGWIRPAIYLPAEEAAELTPPLYDILRHELSHIRRRDGLWDAIARLGRAILVFHPLIHRAYAALRLERELACDLHVVRNNPEQRHLYADTLVRFGWKTSLAAQHDHVGVGFTSQAAVLNRRIRSILAGEPVTSLWSLGARALFSTAACWTAAAVLPALFIAFGLPSIPHKASPVADTSARPALLAPHHTRAVAVAILHQTAPQITPALTTSETEAPAFFIPHTEHPAPAARLFPSADAPMSNVAMDAAQYPANSSRHDAIRPSTPHKTGLPSATSVMLDTETAMSAWARGHSDRDHDHD